MNDERRRARMRNLLRKNFKKCSVLVTLETLALDMDAITGFILKAAEEYKRLKERGPPTTPRNVITFSFEDLPAIMVVEHTDISPRLGAPVGAGNAEAEITISLLSV